MKRFHVFVSGRVQGVFFRASTRRKALEKGVSGWVKNLDDGRLEAVFEGKDEKVDEMIDFCREGPKRADVDEVRVEEEELRSLEGFEIKRPSFKY